MSVDVLSRATFHVVTDPTPGQVVRLPAGSRLEVRFRRRGLGASRWLIEERPGYLLPLVEGGQCFQFLVFGGAEAPTPLRLARRHPDRTAPRELCDVLVVPSAG